MKLQYSFQILVLMAILLSCTSKSKTAAAMDENNLEKALNYPPKWAENQIWYQIFVERFYNGNQANDPKPEQIIGAWPYEVPPNWSPSPWTMDWYSREEWQGQHGRNFYQDSQLRRYGGDLAGVIQKLDYLQELGVTAIYLNPINFSPSLHKYDASFYHHVDSTFGPNPEEDMKQIENEDPNDSSTWTWTSADLLFLELVEQVHQRGMKIIVDFSWNHTGIEFWAWKDIVQHQEQSKYADWYMITSFDNPNTEQNEFDYEGWLGFKSLPELKKINVENRHHGMPYEGDIQAEVKAHIFEVTKRWLAPNGDTSKGIDGFRLDVADQIPMTFWNDYRAVVKQINPEAYLVGEIWWKAFPDQLMNPRPYLGRAAFDAVMFYQVYKPARGFFSENDDKINAQEFVHELQEQYQSIDSRFLRAMMGVNATHDTPRLLSSFFNTTIYKQYAKPEENPNYKSGKPDFETYQRVKLYLLHQFTSLSSPHIWNGDELGMWGADDPDCRKPLWWPEYNFKAETEWNKDLGNHTYEVAHNPEHLYYYKQLISLRKRFEELQFGSMDFVEQKEGLLVYTRTLGEKQLLVAFNVGSQEADFSLVKSVQSEIFTVGDEPRMEENRVVLPPKSAVVLQLSQ